VQTQPSFRVKSWNIAAGGDDLFHVAEVIRRLGPDVAALQEVDVHWDARSAFADQPARLAETLGLEARFGAIYQRPGAPNAPVRQFGLAVLSRVPIVSFRNHTIPRLSTQTKATRPEPLPGFLEVALVIGGARVRVFNTHLDYRGDPGVRRLQVAAMLEVIGDASGPTILAGDLNAPPGAPEIAPLLARLHDAWAAGGDPGHTYPATAPVRRIDYLLHSAALRVVSVSVERVDVADHRPVVADFAFGR